jgi:hypothetical protein
MYSVWTRPFTIVPTVICISLANQTLYWGSLWFIRYLMIVNDIDPANRLEPIFYAFLFSMVITIPWASSSGKRVADADMYGRF